MPSERSSRGGGEVRSTGCLPRAIARARAIARNPSELVPSAASRRSAAPPHGEAVGRSSEARRAEMTRSGTPELRNSGTPELRNSGTPELRNSGTPELRNSGTPELRNSETPELRNSETPPRRTAATRGRCRANEVREAEGRFDQRVACLAQSLAHARSLATRRSWSPPPPRGARRHLPTAKPWGGVPEGAKSSALRDSSAASRRSAAPPHGEAVGRSSEARRAELTRSGTPELRNTGTPELRNSGTPELRNSSPAERSDAGEVPSERSSRGGGEVRSTGCLPRAIARARAIARNPSELVPSAASRRSAAPPHGEAVGRSSEARRAELTRSGTPELRNSGTPEHRNSSPAERSDAGEVPSERSSRGGGEVRSTGCLRRASARARAIARNPSELVPSAASRRSAAPPHGEAVGRSSGRREVERTPKLLRRLAALGGTSMRLQPSRACQPDSVEYLARVPRGDPRLTRPACDRPPLEGHPGSNPLVESRDRIP